MPHDDVAERFHGARWHIDVQLPRFPSGTLLPGATPIPEGRSDVSQALQREHVGSQRDDHAIAGDQGGPVDRAEIGTDIQQRQIGAELLPGPFDQPRKRRRDPKCPLVAVQTLRPLGGQLVFPLGKGEIAAFRRSSRRAG